MTAADRGSKAALSPRDALSAPSTARPDFNMLGGVMERTVTAHVPVRVIKVA